MSSSVIRELIPVVQYLGARLANDVFFPPWKARQVLSGEGGSVDVFPAGRFMPVGRREKYIVKVTLGDRTLSQEVDFGGWEFEDFDEDEDGE